MLDVPLQPLSTDVGASMQFAVWWRDRESGMSWFVGTYLAGAVLAAFNNAVPWGDKLPNQAFVLALYIILIVCVFGLVRYLAMPRRQEVWAQLLLPLPMLLVGVAMVAGLPVAHSLAVAPLLCIDLGFVLLFLVAARREPAAGHLLLALGSLFGAASLSLAFARGVRPVLPRYDYDYAYAWQQVIGFGVVLQVVSLMRRSRQSRPAQLHAQRMANFYVALSQINQTILRVREADALYTEICRICADTDHVRMACVYLNGGDVALRVASAGPAASFLADLPAGWDVATPEPRSSFTAQAMREGVRLVANDYPSELRSRPWRQQALDHDLHAIAWLPLRRNGRVAGVLMLAAAEKHFFDEPLITLLDEMSGDISFALDNIDCEAERLANVQEVQAGQEGFQHLFESVPIASAIVSLAERRLLNVNAAMCARYNAPRDAMIGRRTSALLGRGVVAEDLSRFYEVMEREGHVRNLILQISDEAGIKHPELINADPIEYLGQACFLVMQIDITDLKAAAQARQELASARAASRAKTEFLSQMSHELRTPLNAILGFSALLRHEIADRITVAELAQLDHVQQASGHLLTLINDVLDISQIETGALGVDVRRVLLAPLLDEALRLNQLQASQRAVSLHSNCGGESALVVRADPTRLRQVLLNLLSNAIKYNRAGGSVQVHALRDGDSVMIEVADTGLGMTPEQLEHLFEPFNRLGRERGAIEGTGVGLALTQQLVHLMHGELQVNSESGRGTRVRLRLPACDTADPEPGPTAETLPARSPRGTVLYIEDNAVNSLLVEQMLSRWDGVVFAAAENARTGLERAAALRPDLVLLDMQLPDLDGLEVLRRLRVDPGFASLPIIVLSASAMPEDIARARRAGATDYWTKPLNFQRALSDFARLL